MYIILLLMCEILSTVAVKISFLWGGKHGCMYMQQRHSQQMSRRDTYVTTCKTLHQF